MGGGSEETQSTNCIHGGVAEGGDGLQVTLQHAAGTFPFCLFVLNPGLWSRPGAEDGGGRWCHCSRRSDHAHLQSP